MRRLLVAFAATVLGLSTVHAATLTLAEVNNVSGETTIFLQNATGTTTSTGSIGTNGGTQNVTFTTDVSSSFANGNATITPDTGVLRSVTLSTFGTGITFSDVSFIALGPSGNGSTDVTVTAYLGGVGGTPEGTASLTDIGNGAQLLLSLLSGGVMDTLVITGLTGTGFAQLKNFALSGVGGLSSVPLPPAALLFGTALAGLGVLGRRRKKVV